MLALRRRVAANPSSPAASTTMLAGSGASTLPCETGPPVTGFKTGLTFVVPFGSNWKIADEIGGSGTAEPTLAPQNAGAGSYSPDCGFGGGELNWV